MSGPLRRFALPALLVVLAVGAPTAQAAGTRGPAYVSAGVSAPTGQKPQSKLWFHDGSWWGVLYDYPSRAHEIFKFDWAADTWTSTGVEVDPRERAQADVLWSDGRLYVSTNMPVGTSEPDDRSRVRRYSYDAAAGTHALDAGFPVELADREMESQSIDKDSQGTLWTTYTLDDPDLTPLDASDDTRSVYVQHTVAGSQTDWSAPYVVPVAGATNLTDDISALVAFDGKVGVLWSNGNDGTIHFAVHRDGEGDTAAAWTDHPARDGLTDATPASRTWTISTPRPSTPAPSSSSAPSTPAPGTDAQERSAPAPARLAASFLLPRQRLTRRTTLLAFARCDRRCTIRGTVYARVRVGGATKRLRLVVVRRTLRAGHRTAIHLRLSRQALRQIRSTLRRGRPVSLSVTVRARTAAGPTRKTTARLTVRR